jgi:hypothetical protein
MPAIRVTTDTSGLTGYVDLLKQAPRMVEMVVSGTVEKNQRRYLDAMHQLDPGPSQHRGRWSTDPAANARARRGYWARVRRGEIRANPITGAYIRTGELARGWRLVANKNFTTLFNPAQASAFVYTFGAIVARGGRPNPGHIATRWPQEATTTALLSTNAMINDVHRGIGATIAASVRAKQLRVVIP